MHILSKCTFLLESILLQDPCFKALQLLDFSSSVDNRQPAIYLGVGNAAQGSEIQIKKPLAHTVLQKQAPNMGEQVLLGALHFK